MQRESKTAGDVAGDQFVIIRVEGMHCHTCEKTIQRALASQRGVREVEVDFASGQASILFSRGTSTVNDLIDAIIGAGYRATGFTQGQTQSVAGQPEKTKPEASTH